MSSPQKRIFSGMRPTGPLHLGHLVGALNNWVALQDDYECFYSVVDWHAYMSEYKNPALIADSALPMVADWIACGIDPKRVTIFVQSDVVEHLELSMVLGAITDLPRVERVPTFKEQVGALAEKDVFTYGFLGYPILQTADIALYKADTVPVGDDQLPHLEFAREVIRRFHGFTNSEIFPEPTAKLTQSARLLGTDRRKMSKSYGNTITLAATKDEVNKQVMSMITDESRIRKDDPGHPDICNVCSYFEVFDKDVVPTVRAECEAGKRGCVACKRQLAETLEGVLLPIREKRTELLSEPEALNDILKEGSERASKIARETMQEVKQVIGLPRRSLK